MSNAFPFARIKVLTPERVFFYILCKGARTRRVARRGYEITEVLCSHQSFNTRKGVFLLTEIISLRYRISIRGFLFCFGYKNFVCFFGLVRACVPHIYNPHILFLDSYNTFWVDKRLNKHHIQDPTLQISSSND